MIQKNKVKKVLDCTVFGSTNLGQRGQIVVPKEAREFLKLKKGEKFVVMEKAGCLVLIPSKIAAKFAKQMTEALMV